MSSVTGKIGENLTAITHDSDPRELRFQLINRIDGSVVNDTVSGPPPLALGLADDGTTVLHPASPGALIGALQGGDGAALNINAVQLNQEIVKVKQIFGSLVLTVFTDEPATYNFTLPFEGSLGDLNTYLDGSGPTDFDIFAPLGPFLSIGDLAGKTAVNCLGVVNAAFTGTTPVTVGNAYLDLDNSAYELGIGATGISMVSDCPIRVPISSLNTLVTPGSMSGPYTVADDDQLYIHIKVKTIVQNLWNVSVDASTIVANATAPQKLTQGPATIPVINLADMTPSILGWQIVEVLTLIPESFTASVGLLRDATMQPVIDLTEMGEHFCNQSSLIAIGATNTDFEPPLPGVPADSVLSLIVQINDHGRPAEYAPGMYTEPYEIRNRNLALLRFWLEGGESSEDDYVVEFQVSQDGLTWIRTMMAWYDISSDVHGTFVSEGAFQALPVHLYAPYQAPNVKGWAATIAKNFVGPWNYIRAYLTVDPTAAPRLMSVFPHCVANAREL